MRAPIAPAQPVAPLARRRGDLVFIAFFLVNLLVITYVVDLEQLVIADPNHFTYPLWPPAPAVDAIHWWGSTFDPLLMARPVWWKMTIWLDNLFFGPFYVAAIYAFINGKNWIRVPALFYSGTLFANVVIILGEELAGPHASPNFPVVLLANLPWLLMPVALAGRMARGVRPFAAPVPAVARPAARTGDTG